MIELGSVNTCSYAESGNLDEERETRQFKPPDGEFATDTSFRFIAQEPILDFSGPMVLNTNIGKRIWKYPFSILVGLIVICLMFAFLVVGPWSSMQVVLNEEQQSICALQVMFVVHPFPLGLACLILIGGWWLALHNMLVPLTYRCLLRGDAIGLLLGSVRMGSAIYINNTVCGGSQSLPSTILLGIVCLHSPLVVLFADAFLWRGYKFLKCATLFVIVVAHVVAWVVQYFDNPVNGGPGWGRMETSLWGNRITPHEHYQVALGYLLFFMIKALVTALTDTHENLWFYVKYQREDAQVNLPSAPSKSR